jgi:hypothetical protein
MGLRTASVKMGRILAESSVVGTNAANASRMVIRATTAIVLHVYSTTSLSPLRTT